eukprot:TRINITY_DN123_c0_g1_i10.p1 TRINITY_DN123_c0_g1~~TRINITY_DN123_c0_g1_i10.p1  ORF type:complete len:145 (-),score=27.04 TRINITY_DN123_c0_g1_i10:69-503(-)
MASNHWNFSPEGEYLCLRDHISGGDHRIAFTPGKSSNHGSGPSHPGETGVLLRHAKWSIGEENGILCVRYTGAPGDHRHAFWPGNGNSHNFGHPHAGHGGNHVYAEGIRWVIKEENGIVVFRDKLTPGDHRYAFFPGCGNGVNL